MNRHIVVAFRMPPSSLSSGAGGYLPRARSLCARGEALGGRLVAWSAAILAMAWDTDSIEEAVLLATSILEEAGAKEGAWAVGVAEGELEPLAPDGARMQLAWGQALLLATTLARVARGGEVLIDGELRALRAGQLSLLGARTASDSGVQVRGWKLDMEHPWKRAATDDVQEIALEELEEVDAVEASELDESPAPGPRRSAAISTDVDAAAATTEMPALDFSVAGRSPSGLAGDVSVGGRSPSGLPADVSVGGRSPSGLPADFDGSELSTAEVLEIVEASASLPTLSIAPREAKRGGRLANRVRRLAAGDKSTDAMEAIAELRRERARAEEGGSSSTRCQAALALAMTLAIAGRAEDALLESLDALARAREARDPKAIDACTALLAKLYSSAGRQSEASALLRGA